MVLTILLSWRSLVRFPNQLAFGSWLGERTPKKQGFQLWESFSQPTKFLVTKALQNWNKSCVNWRIWPLWKKFFHTLGHSSPLSPFLPFGHLAVHLDLLICLQSYLRQISFLIFSLVFPHFHSHISPMHTCYQNFDSSTLFFTTFPHFNAQIS